MNFVAANESVQKTDELSLRLGEGASMISFIALWEDNVLKGFERTREVGDRLRDNCCLR